MDWRNYQRYKELQQAPVGEASQACPKRWLNHLCRTFKARQESVYDYGDSEYLFGEKYGEREASMVYIEKSKLPDTEWKYVVEE